MIPAMMGVSHGAVQFMFYEEMKKWLHANDPVDIPLQNNTLEYIGMAATSKSAATVITYPYQVLRARLQDHRGPTQYSGVVDVFVKVVGNEGWRGMYRGLFPNMIRVLPGTCLTFGAYETITWVLKRQ